jgi:hypothetical protein
MRHYVIGDIHGQIDMLKSAHARIAQDRKRTGDEEAPIIHLGDLVDRGPDSAGVIDLLLTGAKNGKPWITLKGNHDRMFSRFARQGIHHDARISSGLSWLDPRLGGIEKPAKRSQRRTSISSMASRLSMKLAPCFSCMQGSNQTCRSRPRTRMI